jgi:hypothetical protein
MKQRILPVLQKLDIALGVDTGGTFTDFVLLRDGRLEYCKVLSTPADPSKAIIEGLVRLGIEGESLSIIHGTTVGTNAVLENKGARFASTRALSAGSPGFLFYCLKPDHRERKTVFSGNTGGPGRAELPS